MKKFVVGCAAGCVAAAGAGVSMAGAAEAPKAGGTAAAATAKSADADKAALQGAWQVLKQEMRGGPGPGDVREQRMVFAGETFKLVSGDKTMIRGTFKVDPTKTPKVMEMIVTEGAGSDEGAPVHGIYELRGDDLAWCAGEPGNDARPEKFDTKGTTNVLIRAKRAAKE